MSSVTYLNGEVVIRCSVEEAMGMECVLVASRTAPEVEQRVHGVWDMLDDFRVRLMATNPGAIPEALRQFRLAIGRRR